jgi:hypothetical protein
MTDHSISQTIKETSLNELVEIFRWLRNRGEDESHPTTVLIGGWAVYTYNQWYGSIDIDLVTNSRTRRDLMEYLKYNRGFVPLRDPMRPSTTVMKEIQEGGNRTGDIIIDFMSREEICRFEGREEQCPFSLLDRRTEAREIGQGFSVIVPEQTLLMIFKLKAAWDRSFRIQNGRSSNMEWEKAKLGKDRADILSLIDPDVRGTEIDIQYLGERLQDYRFLEGTLREISDDIDAINFYGRITQDKVRHSVEALLQLAL